MAAATKVEAVMAQPAMFGDLGGWRACLHGPRAGGACVRGDWMARSGETLIIEDPWRARSDRSTTDYQTAFFLVGTAMPAGAG